jgi:hypothetical protein
MPGRNQNDYQSKKTQRFVVFSNEFMIYGKANLNFLRFGEYLSRTLGVLPDFMTFGCKISVETLKITLISSF